MTMGCSHRKTSLYEEYEYEMRSWLFATTAKAQAASGHLSQAGQAESGGKRDQLSPQMQTLIIYTGGKRHFQFLPSSSPSLCTDPSVAAHRPSPAPRAEPHTGKTEAAFPWRSVCSWRRRAGDAHHVQPRREPARSVQRATIPLLPSAPTSSTNQFPQEAAFVECIF